MAITRTAMVDDSGGGTDGTVINNAWKTELYGQIDVATAFPGANVGINTASLDVATARLQINALSTDVLQLWKVTDAAAHDKLWDVLPGTLSLSFRLVDDAYASATNYLVITRNTGAVTVASVAFPKGHVVVNATALDSTNIQHEIAGLSTDILQALKVTDAAAHDKLWDLQPGVLALTYRVVDDAYAAAQSWLVVTRNTGAVTVASVAFPNGGITVGPATGGSKGQGTINLSSGIYLNNVAMTQPDYVLEHAYTGRIERFKANRGAAAYPGLRSLADVDAFLRDHFTLPLLATAPEGDLFERADLLLASLEEAFLHLITHDRRLTALEAQAA